MRLHVLDNNYKVEHLLCQNTHEIKGIVYSQRSYPQAYYSTELILSDVSLDNQYHLSHSIRCLVHGSNTFLPGDSLKFTGNLKQNVIQSDRCNPQKRTLAQCYMDKNNITQISSSVRQRLLYLFPRLKELLKHRFSRLMNKQTWHLFSSLFLGLSPAYSEFESTKKQFLQWGVVHMLARSGLHIMIIIGLWSLLLALFPFGYILRQYILLACLILYKLLSWSSISFMRACLMFICAQYFTMRELPALSIYTFTLTSLIILLHNPYELFALDFQLSFSITFCILIWYHLSVFADHEIIAKRSDRFLN